MTERLTFRRSPYDREIFRLAVPALGALVAEPLYILADTAVVGRLGTVPLAGLAVASSILLLGYSIFVFLAYGTTASVARLLGAGNEREAAHQAVQGMWLALAIGILVALVTAAAAAPLVRLLGAQGAVADAAELYLRISLVGVPAQLLVLAGTGYLRGLQDTRTPLIVAVVSAAGNLVLEIVLIFGLGFGLGASALSTVLAQWGAATAYIVWVALAVHAHEVPLGPDRRALARLAVMGRDLFIRTAALRGALVAATAVATRIGTPDVAAHQIGYEIWSFLALVLDAIAIAGQAITGRFLGAENLTDARAAGRRMIEWSVLIGVVLGLVVSLSRSLLPHLFTSDPLVLRLAAFVLVFVALMQPLNGAVFALDGLLIGAGDLRYLAWAMVGPFVVFVGCAWLVSVNEGGLGWLWLSIGLFMLLRLLTLAWRWHGDHWAVLGPTR